MLVDDITFLGSHTRFLYPQRHGIMMQMCTERERERERRKKRQGDGLDWCACMSLSYLVSLHLHKLLNLFGLHCLRAQGGWAWPSGKASWIEIRHLAPFYEAISHHAFAFPRSLADSISNRICIYIYIYDLNLYAHFFQSVLMSGSLKRPSHATQSKPSTRTCSRSLVMSFGSSRFCASKTTRCASLPIPNGVNEAKI